MAADHLRQLVPPELPLDTYDGHAWVAVAPFHMSGIHARGFAAIPGLSRFPELNVRTYVTLENKPGVFFFSLDVTNIAAVWAARIFYHLPYYRSRIRVEAAGEEIAYSSQRVGAKAEFRARYRPIGPVRHRSRGTIEHWLTERYCLYAVARGRVYRAEIHHLPWPLQDATAEIETNSMASAAGFELGTGAPLLHFSRRLEVLIWPQGRLS